MRIQLVSPYLPERDGIADYTAILRGELVAQGHEVTVVVPRRQSGRPAEVVGSLERGGRAVERLGSSAKLGGTDVVHVEFCVGAFGSAIPALLRLLRALRRASVPVVITFHDITRDIARLGAAGRWLYRRFAARADAIIVHTKPAENLATEVRARRDQSVFVIPHFVPQLPEAAVTADQLSARWQLGGKRILLAFGFIHIDKGLDDLVRALAELRDEGVLGGENAQLVVAGSVRGRAGVFRALELSDRIHLARVKRLVRRSRLSDRVTFTGYVPSGEVAAWFSLADAAVLPYRRIEQSGVASLAAAAGTPVLASDVGELSAFSRQRDWTWPPGEPRQIARSLRAFLSGPAAPAARASREHQVREIAAATIHIYELVVSAGSAPMA
jgi:glycosyltransferase involved in cell wall biosynthesis